MVNKGLVDYIDNLVRRGYNINYVRSYLLSYGYNPQEVDESINHLYSVWQKQWQDYQQSNQQYPQPAQVPTNGFGIPQEQVSKPNHSLIMGITIILIIVIIISSSFLLYKSFLNNPKIPLTLLDLEINLVKTEYYAGDSLEFVPNIRNMGSKNRFDMVLISKVVKPGSGIVIVKKEEEIAIETTYSGIHTLRLPETIEPGKYELNVSAKYGNTTTYSTQQFLIKSRTPEIIETENKCDNNKLDQGENGIDCGGSCKPCPSCEDHIKNQGESGVDCGGPCNQCKPIENKQTCDDGILNQDEVKIDCGGACVSCPEEVNPKKILMEVKEISASDPEGASQLCEKLEVEATKDECFRNVASFSSEPDYCDYISFESKKDLCFMFFIIKGDYSLCDQIINTNLKQSCESLQKLDQQKQNIGANPPLIIENNIDNQVPT